MTKEQLRIAFLERRQSLASDFSSHASNVINRSCLELLREIKPKSVVLYHAFRGEVTTSLLFSESRKRKIALAFPRRMEGTKKLRFFRVSHLSDLEKGKHLAEPKLDQSKELVSAEIDLFLLPGLAFDMQGYRLGYGQGHYDHTLADFQRDLLIGIAFDFQVVSSLPWSGHDVNVSRIVTEKRIIECW